MNNEERTRLIDMAKRAGFRVYQRDPEKDTWFYFTDGTHIGYCQFPDRLPSSLTTVHQPSTSAGTGFAFADGPEVTAESMKQCAHTHCPAWFNRTGWSSSVHKFRDWEHFTRSSKFNSEYRLVD